MDTVDVVDSGRVSHEMSTTNRGRMVSMDRGSLIGKHPNGPAGREGLNVSTNPDSYQYGPQGDTGELDASNNGWTDCDPRGMGEPL